MPAYKLPATHEPASAQELASAPEPAQESEPATSEGEVDLAYDKNYAYAQALASLQEPSEEEYRQIALAERATEAMLEDSL